MTPPKIRPLSYAIWTLTGALVGIGAGALVENRVLACALAGASPIALTVMFYVGLLLIGADE